VRSSRRPATPPSRRRRAPGAIRAMASPFTDARASSAAGGSPT
jgi:hypothetical protein